jgi:tetratricopeptide (TPR) repeat protein
MSSQERIFSGFVQWCLQSFINKNSYFLSRVIQGWVMKKQSIILITGLVMLIILAAVVIGTKVLVKAQNQDFKKDPEFYKSLGNYLAEKEDYANAIVAYESCLLLGDDKDVRNNLAVIYYKQGKYSEAINQLQTLIQLEPDNPSYHYDLAINLVDRFRNSKEQSLADLENALVEYEKVDALQPGYSHARDNIEVLKRIIGE